MSFLLFVFGDAPNQKGTHSPCVYLRATAFTATEERCVLRVCYFWYAFCIRVAQANFAESPCSVFCFYWSQAL